MSDNTEVPMDHYIVMSANFPGYWGRGKTIDAAVRAAMWFNRGDQVRVYRCDAEARVNELGGLIYKAHSPVGVGALARGRDGEWTFKIKTRAPLGT